MITLFLYIDPGTGSMLFSILIGAIATLYFLLKAVVIKIKFMLTGKDIGRIPQTTYSYVIYCEGKQYWNLFTPIVTEFEKRQIPVMYYTSAEEDPLLNKHNTRSAGISIKKIKKSKTLCSYSTRNQ